MESSQSTLDEWVLKVGLAFQNPFNQISGAKYTVFEELAFGLENIGVPRDEMKARIPAVTHIDGTARVQTVNRAQHALYYDLIAAFKARTGVPVLVNTSFNTRGEPMVNTPRDALESFWTSPLDVLVIGSFLIEKPGVRA